MVLELKKRLATSIILLLLLISMYFYIYILIISLIIFALIAWIEFYGLITKIFHKNKILKFIFKSLSLAYLSMLVLGILYVLSYKPELKIFFVYSILVSIASDIGGLIFGKLFKGKKLTKISPNKTISGAMGSFLFSLILVPFYLNIFTDYKIFLLILITISISLTSQMGDLFISFLKRKASVKNTSNLLPGHGGVLDRIDGMIFAIPVGLILFYI